MVLSPDPLVGSATHLGLLLALSGHFWTARRMSAFVGKADISDACSNVSF